PGLVQKWRFVGGARRTSPQIAEAIDAWCVYCACPAEQFAGQIVLLGMVCGVVVLVRPPISLVSEQIPRLRCTVAGGVTTNRGKGHCDRTRTKRSGFLRWREQLHHLFEENIYHLYNYPNPPIMAILLKPLAELPPLVGSLGLFYLKVAMTLIALGWVFRLVES